MKQSPSDNKPIKAELISIVQTPTGTKQTFKVESPSEEGKEIRLLEITIDEFIYQYQQDGMLPSIAKRKIYEIIDQSRLQELEKSENQDELWEELLQLVRYGEMGSSTVNNIKEAKSKFLISRRTKV